MTKSIPLTQGKFALVDDEDYEYLSQYKWHFDGNYASRHDPKRRGHHLKMHREIAQTPIDMFTDHINSNKLDNRRANLRVCTEHQNNYNASIRSDNLSGFKGVYWSKEKKKWCAQICYKSKQKHLGGFSNPVDAAKAYDIAARAIQGEFAKLNFP